MILYPSRVTLIVTSALLIGLLPGCAKKRTYYPQPLRPLTKNQATFESTKDGISVSAKKLTANETMHIFGSAGNGLFKKPVIYPIQLTIKNQREKTIKFDERTINLNLCSPGAAIDRLKHNTGGRAAGIITTGVLTTASAVITAAFIIPCSFEGFIIGCYLLSSAIFVTPVTFSKWVTADSARATENNEAIVYDIAEKTKDGFITIHPGELINILLFVQEQHYKPTFDISFASDGMSKEKTTFNVNLEK